MFFSVTNLQQLDCLHKMEADFCKEKSRNHKQASSPLSYPWFLHYSILMWIIYKLCVSWSCATSQYGALNMVLYIDQFYTLILHWNWSRIMIAGTITCITHLFLDSAHLDHSDLDVKSLEKWKFVKIIKDQSVLALSQDECEIHCKWW